MDPRGVQMDNPFINSMQETTYNGLTDTTTIKHLHNSRESNENFNRLYKIYGLITKVANGRFHVGYREIA